MKMMNKIQLIGISIIIIAAIASGQTSVTTAQAVQSNGVYTIPFGTANNTIELTVANTSAQSATGVKVEGVNIPAWIHLTPEMQTIQTVDEKADKEVTFTFAVDKTAPVKKEQTLTFNITTSTGERWTKQIKIMVAAPDRFELFQNYPNPFNPTTKIEYQLPTDGLVNLKVYNLLGEEVATIVNEQQEAGYKSIVWNAGSVSSGVYIYRLQCGHYSAPKKMVVVK
jgi:hypothetical protein